MRKRVVLLLVLSVFLLASVGVSYAGWANPDLLVTPEIVKKNITKPDWVVVDCRGKKAYAKGHIPGAISLGKRCKKAFRDPTARVWKKTSKYEKMLGKAGIGNNTHVVFYHGNIKSLNDSAVAFWVLEYLGHDGKTHVLNGGLEAWKKAGYKLTKKPAKKKPTTFKAKVVKSRKAPMEEIVGIATGKIKGVQLVDSRSKKEYVGKDCRAVKCGHVPNVTLNVSHIKTVAKKVTKKGKKVPTSFIDYEATAKAFASLDKNKRTIAYCQTGTRSTLTYLEFRLLGFKNPANWDDSWRVYGSSFENYPIAAPNGAQYYNFAKVNKTLKKLEKRIKKLEKMLKRR